MFRFFKRQPRPQKLQSKADYQEEFQQRARALYDKFAVEDTPYDELVDAMAAIDNEMNRNGGGNWASDPHGEYLEVIWKHLTADPQFSEAQLEKIEWALDEINACGEELEKGGQSSRSVEEPIDYLVARVVDWCRTHEGKAAEEPGS